MSKAGQREPTERVNLTLSPWHKEWFDKLAHEQRVSMSELLRRWIQREAIRSKNK